MNNTVFKYVEIYNLIFAQVNQNHLWFYPS